MTRCLNHTLAGDRKTKMNDILNKLKSINFETITTEELEHKLPLLGLNNEFLHEFPPELHSHCTGEGLKFWQYPNQFAPYLKFLSKIEVNSYLEIGCRWGGTFVIVSEVLKKNNPHINLYACDIINMSPVLEAYSEVQEFTYFNQSSFSLKKQDLNNNIDMVFIDGLHKYDAVEKDFRLALDLDAQYIIFHDIDSHACTGSVKHWNELKHKYKDEYTFHEFTKQYNTVQNNYLGIGVMEKLEIV